MTIGVVLLVWVLSALAGVAIGARKNRRGLLYGLFLPVVGPILLALLPARPTHDDALGTAWDETYSPSDDSFFKNQQYYSKH